jgi:D-3-phosphoglycerate dehydrogenase
MAAKQLKEYLETGKIVNSVNMPECILPFTGKYRIAVIHENTSGMVGKMTAMVAEMGANITDMVNKSKGNVAYTAINLDEVAPDEFADNIRKISGVVRVRTFEK